MAGVEGCLPTQVLTVLLKSRERLEFAQRDAFHYREKSIMENTDAASVFPPPFIQLGRLVPRKKCAQVFALVLMAIPLNIHKWRK